MSFVFSWDKLDDEVALQIEGMIHAHFQRIPKPAFMGNIAVSKFRFGSTPPSITVLDVTDPLEEWYVHMDQEEARLAQEAAEAGGGESLDEDELASDEDDYDDPYTYSADESIVMVGEGDDIEYLDSAAYEEEERDRMRAEEWLRQNHGERTKSGTGSSSGDSYKGGVLNNRHEDQAANSSRTGLSRNEESGLEQNRGAHPRVAQNPLKSRRSTLSRTSPSSTASSASSEKSHNPRHQSRAPTATKRANPNLKLDIEASLPSSSQIPSARKLGTSHSLSSHASDEEIESEAFYTHGESTIYQRMKNMALESTSLLPPRPASIEDDTSEDAFHYHKQHNQHGSAYFPTTPGAGTSHGNNNNGGLGLGFGAGIGASPGSVLSSVMQNRSSTRPLSASSFYSGPSSASVTSPTGRSSQQPPQLYFPDLSGMVLSGNSLLGLRAGTPSRTIPSTPKGFESPTLAFSRRQSFSDAGDEPMQRTLSASAAADRAFGSSNGVNDRDKRLHHSSAYVSPVEALNFDAFSERPKVVERLDEERAEDKGNRGILLSQSIERDQQSRGSSSYQRQEHRGQRQNKSAERKARKQPEADRYSRTSERTTPLYVSPAPSKRNENDIQLLLSVNYQGQMGFTVETEMLLNYPTFAFLALPVKLVITGFSFKAKVLMGYLRDHVNVCFLEPEDPSESILSNVRIESQVGDEQKHAVLKNVGKIERFVVEQLRKFITEDFVYPSYHSIELQRAPPPPSADSPAQWSQADGSSGGATASHVDAPVPHNDKRAIEDVGNRLLGDARGGPFNVSIQAGIAGAILIGAGLLLSFFGYRLFHITMFLIGFYFFGNVSYIAMANAGVVSQTWLLIVAIGVGIVGGLLLICCSTLGVAVLGALALYSLGLWILGLKSGGLITSGTGRIILLVSMAVMGFILGLCREREMVIIGSAIVGAYSFVIGVDMFVHTGFTLQADSFINSKNPIENVRFENQTPGAYGLLGAFVGLTVLGMIFQFWSFGRRNFRPTAVTPASGKVVSSEKPSGFGGIFRRR
ncbi:Mitochondrial distribution and morphology protein 12 [Mortierella alpina]|uniref:Mitochondrial distribution and morphology protein 12 n=1 Tax=Mortierella alpina TaxID=64518 RepID=A0A9P6JAK4_MORAP|nr:Mitochondrial distribution and morphology protein 12 [Mortierella alpina]